MHGTKDRTYRQSISLVPEDQLTTARCGAPQSRVIRATHQGCSLHLPRGLPAWISFPPPPDPIAH